MAKKGHFLDSNDFLCVTEIIKLVTSIALPHQVFISIKDPDTSTDALGHSLLISCDTNYMNTGSHTGCDSITSLRLGWIQHANK
jgi:hypothetical protein